MSRPSPATPLCTLVVLTGAMVMTGCTGAEPVDDDAAGGGEAPTVYMGARLIDGNGGPAIEEGVIVVEGGHVAAAGPVASTEVPEGATVVDLSGKTVMPAVVNAHIHLSSDRTERTNQLRQMAYYGAGLVVSLGHDAGTVPLDLRSETIPDGARSMSAGPGITTPEPGRSETPIWVTTPDEARQAVREHAAQDVDIVKIWVDDRGGRYDRLTEDLYGPIIEEAHAHDLMVTAHIFTLEDAKGLLQAGVDAFAHGIRDQDVDDELVALWKARPDVVLVPNLPNPGVARDLSWLSDMVAPDDLAEMQANAVDRPEAQASFGIQARNLDRLHSEGVTIAFGTDGSSPWAVHEELEDMVRAGMSPSDVLVAATRNSASLMKVRDLGTIEPGKSASFVVLDANPLDDITNTRRIHSVVLDGVAVDREAISQR